MEIPVYAQGRPLGRLNVRREGLYTVLETRLPPAEGLTRLYLCGGGARVCLGVMEPRAEGLVFRRRYSRAGLRALPFPADYAAVDAAEPALPELSAGPSADPPAVWTRRPDGSLTRPGWLALPCALRRPVPGLRLAVVEGRLCLLFRTWQSPGAGV